MNDKVRFLRWIGYMCIVLIGFAIGIFIVGYQPPTFGRVATLVVLTLGAIASFTVANRMKSGGKR